MEEFIGAADLDENVIGQYLLGVHGTGRKSSPVYCPVQIHKYGIGQEPPLARDIPESISLLSRYGEYLADMRCSGSPVTCDHQQFFLSKGYAFTDFHYDTYDNFYVVATGKRRWTLACPNASRWFLDSSSSGRFRSGSQLVPHKNLFPAGSPAQVYPFAVVDLMPGDTLFVPSCWWHLVESIPGEDGFSSAFNFFFSQPPNEVFSSLERRLNQTESEVNRIQTECRERSRNDNASPVSSILLNAPRRIHQTLWEQLLHLASFHEISADLHTLRDLLYTDSIFQFENFVMRVPSSFSFLRDSNYLKSKPRLSDVSTLPDEDVAVENYFH
jgi:hypothetical protein